MRHSANMTVSTMLWLTVAFFNCYAQRHYAERRYAESRYAERRYAERSLC